MTRAILALVLAAVVGAETQRSGAASQECTGTGNLPSGAPLCYGGQLLVEKFAIKVVSYEGNSGVVDMEMEGPHTGQCSGAAFHNEENVITIADGNECGLADSEYTVKYCPDQDLFVISIVKPWSVDVVLNSQTCELDGENSYHGKREILP
mmetsp:Transcript_46251/g.86346  ORF Transcript_46251/g.86346 Transcript_46251/m.86346 type:complete len:151 (+) Transcript_46251:66-518(+)